MKKTSKHKAFIKLQRNKKDTAFMRKMKPDKIIDLIQSTIDEKEIFIKQLKEASQKKRQYDSLIRHYRKHLGNCDKIIEKGTEKLIKSIKGKLQNEKKEKNNK
jgi:hypothetical protein